MMKNLKRNWLVVSKLTWGIWRILTRALENLKNLHFNGLLLTKVYNVWAKKVQRSYVWLHSRLIQGLKENWLVFPKIDMRNLANFHQSNWTSPNWDLDDIICLKLKMYELKIYKGVMSHDNEEWCQNWRGIDLSVQNWHQEFSKFWPKYSKISKTCTLMGFFWTKFKKFELLASFHQNIFKSLKMGLW